MMPKKREAKDEDVDVLGLLPPHKRHKKHKHKKHKRKRGGTDQEEEAPSPPASPQSGDGSKPALKLKIKIGGQQALEKNVTRADEPSSHSEDEEEAWLEALESGRLEEVDDELRKMKDPTLMTARQRALLESKSKDKDEDGPVQVEPIKEMTEEMIQRRMQRAKKRKQQAEEKKEKDKKQTIERLLKKSESRLRASKKPAKKADTPKVSLLRSSEAGTLLMFPAGLPFPLAPAAAPREYPQKALCSIKGCPNPKKYSCSKTGVSLCSLECYKANMLQMCV
ncbi:INO80 complex subunit B [Dermacentor andersoni]|uniref:INO80 complex subunit B n=1 Tax=Dermacentor andersoni TaxID=34620 RepID=UPI002155D50C|nr:INO80 complex subunit B-like [Dermacentor andersoni]